MKARIHDLRPRGPRIAINGKYLHEIRTRLHDNLHPGAVSYLQLPEAHHRISQGEGAIVLRVPAITALQLYHDGVLPVDRTQPVSLAIDGRELGTFYIAWLRRPAEQYDPGEPVLLRFERAPTAEQPAVEPRAPPPVERRPPLHSLTPLRVHERGTWDPADEYWGEEGEPIEEWARTIIARGPRPEFEMEQVLPGSDPDDFDSDPMLVANELSATGRHAAARKLLFGLIEQDARCLDAYAHLGGSLFPSKPKVALDRRRTAARSTRATSRTIRAGQACARAKKAIA